MPEYFKETVKSFGIRQLFCRFMEEYLWLLIKYIPGFEGMFLRYLFLKLMTKKCCLPKFIEKILMLTLILIVNRQNKG